MKLLKTSEMKVIWGIDSTHNPEFTMCEFYLAYSDYFQLMDMTEELLRKIVFELYGTYTIQITLPKEKDKVITVDFSQPFRRISLIDELEVQTKKKLSHLDLSSKASKFS